VIKHAHRDSFGALYEIQDIYLNSAGLQTLLQIRVIDSNSSFDTNGSLGLRAEANVVDARFKRMPHKTRNLSYTSSSSLRQAFNRFNLPEQILEWN
jgi:hypothetical protein